MGEAKRENEYWDYSQLDDQQRTGSKEEEEEDRKRHRFEMGTKKHELPYKNITNLSENNLREKNKKDFQWLALIHQSRQNPNPRNGAFLLRFFFSYLIKMSCSSIFRIWNKDTLISLYLSIYLHSSLSVVIFFLLC